MPGDTSYRTDGNEVGIMSKVEAQRKPVVEVQSYSYQPSKAELEADISVDAFPEEIRDALMRPVTVVEAGKS